MLKNKTARQFPAKRKFVLRRDLSVGTGQREIERVFNLLAGSVRLFVLSGRRARSEKSIGALLADRGW